MLKYLIAIWMPIALFGFNDSPKCLVDLQTNFFPPEVVNQSFDMYMVFQSHWQPIVNDLTIEAKRVPDLMRARARAMRPNPLEHPFDPEKTKELLLAIEFEVFKNVMVHNYYYKLDSIQGMFDYIVSRQQTKIDACLGKKKSKPTIPSRI